MTLPDRTVGASGHVADHNLIHGMLRYGYFSIADYDAVPDSQGAAAANVTAIQSAITAARAVGGTVYIPPRTFYIQSTTSTIFDLNAGGLTIKGDGRASCLKIKDDDGDYSCIFGSSIEGVSDVHFADFRVDQNPVGNDTCDIDHADPATAQRVIHLWEVTNITVDRVHFDPCCGVQTVSIGGTTTTATTGAVRDCRFRFVKGATTTTSGGFTWYDNSSVYMELSDQVVVGNQWKTTLADDAFACVEIHGGRATMTGNVSVGYETLVNIVSKIYNPSPPPVYDDVYPNTITVANNSVTDAGKGIMMWPISSRALRDVVIANNTVHINALARDADANHGNFIFVGIGVAYNTGVTGSVDNCVIANNVVDYDADTSTNYDTFETLAGGIVMIHDGPMDGMKITGNIVRNAPKWGIVVWARNNTAGTTYGLRNVVISDNLTIDAGLNTVGNSYYRSHVGLLTANPTVKGVYIMDNKFIDTGTGALKGVYAITGSIGSGLGSDVQLARNVYMGYFATPPNNLGDVHSSVALKHDRFQVGNSVAATENIGKAVSKKIEVFDPAGTSLGFVPVYSSIT